MQFLFLYKMNLISFLCLYLNVLLARQEIQELEM